MKNIFLVLAVTLLPTQTLAETTMFSTSNGVSYLASNIGSKVTIQLQSNKPSVFSGNFGQTFSYQNGATNFARSFTFTGNTNFNVTSTINTNSFTWTNNPSFKW